MALSTAASAEATPSSDASYADCEMNAARCSSASRRCLLRARSRSACAFARLAAAAAMLLALERLAAAAAAALGREVAVVEHREQLPALDQVAVIGVQRDDLRRRSRALIVTGTRACTVPGPATRTSTSATDTGSGAAGAGRVRRHSSAAAASASSATRIQRSGAASLSETMRQSARPPPLTLDQDQRPAAARP